MFVPLVSLMMNRIGRLILLKMSRIGKEWLWRRIYKGMLTVEDKDTFVDPKELEKVKTKDHADELFVFMLRKGEWNFGRFIVHMEGMRQQLPVRDFEDHKEWVFNNHSSRVPSFKELLKVAIITLIRCCNKIIL